LTGNGSDTTLVDQDWGLVGGSAEQNPWSPSGSRLLVSAAGGQIAVLDFDQKHFRVSRVPCPPGNTAYDNKLGGLVLNYHGVKDAYFSRVSDDVVLGSDKVRYVNSYNIATGATTMLWDSGALSNGRLYSFSTGMKDDTVAMATGGTKADTDTTVIWHQFSTGATRTLNTMLAFGKPIHNVRLSLEGRYVEIALTGGAGTPYVWDTATGITTPLSPVGAGHRAAAYGAFLNAQGSPLDPTFAPCLAKRWAGAFSNLTFACVAGWTYGSQPIDVHLNWADAVTPALAPVLSAAYWDDPSADPFVPGRQQTAALNNELYAMSPADGTVWRFGFVYATGGYSNFSYQPICTMTRAGDYAACSSNNAQTWGLAKSGNPRIDVKIFELPLN